MSDTNDRDYLDADKRARDIDALRDKADFAPMSDIQPTEADREEALKRLRDEEEVRIKVAEVKIAACGLAEYYSDGDLVEDLRETKRGNGMEAPEEYVINYYEACARVRQYCARIRADAVKAERQRTCNNLKASIAHDVSKGPEKAFFNLGLSSAINLILSDDQEAQSATH